MTRILYWNIENFSVNKFWNPLFPPAQDRLDYFLYAFDNWAVLGPFPEIVVIVELESGVTGLGTLVTANGPAATQNLVNEVRNWTGNANWMAVPSLYAGPQEGVIVLYDSTNLIFTGPNTWPGGGGPSVIPLLPAMVAPVLPGPVSTYPAAWNPYIRTGLLNRAIPAGAQYNANRWENQMAARVAGFTSSGGAGLPPGTAAGLPLAGALMDGNLGPRTPYMVTFFRPATAENITLFAIHAPAGGNAYNYMTALACTQEIASPPIVVQNERKVVVGDFNLDLFNGVGTLRQRYQNFQLLGYTIGVVPPLGGPPAPPFGYYDYFSTHLFPTAMSANWSTMTNPRYYPGYYYLDDSRIDNIFVNSGVGVAPTLVNTTILNPAVGSPYNQNPPPAPPGAAPTGFYSMDILVNCYAPPNPPAIAPPHMVWMNAWRGWLNIRHIRSTSDHLPIKADC